MAQKKKIENKAEKVIVENKEVKEMVIVNGFTTIIMGGKEMKASHHTAKILIAKGIAKLA